MIDQAELYELFTGTDERTQAEVIRTLREHQPTPEEKTIEELKRENELLREQVSAWQNLFSQEQKMHLIDLETLNRITERLSRKKGRK